MYELDRYKPDKDLAVKIAGGDKTAWNEFINTYSDYILSNILHWCYSTCRVISESPECAVEKLKFNKNVADSGNSCDEGVELYIFIFKALKPKLAKYQGKSSLKTYITACLRFIYSDYFILRHGKINIPVALKETDETDKKVYKVLCRSSNLENALEKLEKIGIEKSQSLKSFQTIIDLLGAEGKDKIWQHLYSQFLKNQKPEPLINTDNEGNETDTGIISYDSEYSNKEIIGFFEQCFNELDSKAKRLLKLKFKDDLPVKEVFLKFGKVFGFEKEQEVYSELDKIIKLLINKIRSHYQQTITGTSDSKEFKEALYDIFKLIEV